MVGLEILEDELLDERFVHALIELKRQGYRLALDDFQYSVSAERLLGLVDVVKLDVLALGRERMAREVARLQALRRDAAGREGRDARGRTPTAPSSAATCSRASSSAGPSCSTTAGSSPTARRCSRSWPRSRTPPCSSRQLERLIGRDVGLSFRLLRYINSAFFGLRFEISSIGQALALLGVENLRRWATLTVLASIDGKPPELTVTALVRARFCELAGEQLPARVPASCSRSGCSR